MGDQNREDGRPGQESLDGEPGQESGDNVRFVPPLAVILAAGAGSRFPGPTHKLEARFRGRPLLVHAVETAVGACDTGRLQGPLIVSGALDLAPLLAPLMEARTRPTPARDRGPDERDPKPLGIRLIHNDEWADGQSSSLQRAVGVAQECGAPAIVVALGDQPLLAVEDWLAVAASTAAVATGDFGGAARPPVKLHRSVWHLLPTSGDEGARVLMRSAQVEVEKIVCQGNPVDIDSDKDLQQWN